MGYWIVIKKLPQWYLGKIESYDVISSKKKIRVGNLLSRVDTKSKHFKLSLPQETKEIMVSDVICNIRLPKELKQPKNVFSITEFAKIEKQLKA